MARKKRAAQRLGLVREEVDEGKEKEEEAARGLARRFTIPALNASYGNLERAKRVIERMQRVTLRAIMEAQKIDDSVRRE